ncbi:MAG: M48 family metalloprotease [bacterium]|nr:M48 family metalloprotease [bacterium]
MSCSGLEKENSADWQRNNRRELTRNWLKTQFPPVSSSQDNLILSEILERLLYAAERAHFSSERTFRIYLSCDTGRTAVSDGFGDIYISQGLLKAFDNDGQLYATLAHELSHYFLKHFSISQNRSSQSEDFAQTTGLPHESGPRLNINEADEIAADILSLKLLHFSGFSSRHAAQALGAIYATISGKLPPKQNVTLRNRLDYIEQEIANYPDETFYRRPTRRAIADLMKRCKN